jgi:hypothetical protein
MASKFSGKRASRDIRNWTSGDESNTEATTVTMAVITRAVKLYNRYQPRKTQLTDLVMFLSCTGRGWIGNKQTGEGKYIISVMLAICLALVDIRVDVITSSKELQGACRARFDGQSPKQQRL